MVKFTYLRSEEVIRCYALTTTRLRSWLIAVTLRTKEYRVYSRYDKEDVEKVFTKVEVK